MADRPPRALVLSGGPHPFHETTPRLVELLAMCGLDVEVTEWPDEAAALLAEWSPAVWVCNTLRWRMLAPKYDETRDCFAYATPAPVREAFSGWVRGGGRLLALHAAPICFDDWPGWGEVVGARWDWERSGHPPLGDMDVKVVGEHPITAGLDDFTITDEAYGRMWLADDVEPLAVASWEGGDHPILWARQVGEGRVVTSTLGHGAESFDHPSHRRILRAAVAWLTEGDGSAGERGGADA